MRTTTLTIVGISIHAPRTGSDDRAANDRAVDLYFNPRSPYGERQQKQPKSLTIFAKMRQFCKISTLGFLLSVNILRLFSQFG